MKTIRVVAAIMIDNGKVFATQRGSKEYLYKQKNKRIVFRNFCCFVLHQI